MGAFGPDPAENRAFLSLSRHFRGAELPVPEIFTEDPAAGVYLQEDLGDTTLFAFLSACREPGEFPSDAVPLYEQAVRILPRFQIEAGRTLDYSVCYPRATFDERSILWDLNHFKYYFLRLAKIPFHEQELEDDFHRFSAFLLETGQEHFMYRDFQSRNIMVQSDRLRFIDYQGGRRGPLQYDIASLLYDAKADVPPELRERLLEAYLDEAQAVGGISKEPFRRHFPAYVLVRILQALGAYGLRGFHERKAHFLQSIPFALKNLEHLLETEAIPVKIPALQAVFRAMINSPRLRRFEEPTPALTVRVQSFAYPQGLPPDDSGHGGGFVFDCRSLPNPGRQPAFAPLTGKDREVAEFLGSEPSVREFLAHAFALADQSVENYRARGFTRLLVSFGCTGGRHRSVYCAERLAERLRTTHDVRVRLEHVALDPGGAASP